MRTTIFVLVLSASAATLGCNNLLGANEPLSQNGGPYIDIDLGENLCGNGIIDNVIKDENGYYVQGEEQCDSGGNPDPTQCDDKCKVVCDPGFLDTITNHCYQVRGTSDNVPATVDGSTLAWEDAKNDCEAWGGTLAVITGAPAILDVYPEVTGFDELAFVQDILRQDTWVGAQFMNNIFKWTTGEQLSGMSGEGCVMIEEASLGFVANACAQPKAYLCERAPLGSPVQP